MTEQIFTAGDHAEKPPRDPKTQFILVGFSHRSGFRIFAFEGVAADRSRTEFTVNVELSLLPRYGIHMQDLPLLCRELLERRNRGEDRHALTFTEDEMRVHSDHLALLKSTAAQKRKAPRRPAPDPALPWRYPQPR